MWPFRKRVEATIRYLRDDTAHPEIHSDDPQRTILPLVEHRVRFHDVRDGSPPPSLQHEGFMRLGHRSEVTDFSDADQIRTIYLAELDGLMRQVTGSTRVFIHPKAILRSAKHRQQSSSGVIKDGPAHAAHTDYTDRSVWIAAGTALRHHGVELAPQGRMVAYTLWRAITPPPQDLPLAMCDLRTVKDEDMVRVASFGNIGSDEHWSEIFLLLHDPGHRWCYFSDMAPDDLLILQQHDTGRQGPTGCPHSGFSDPTHAQRVAARVSIETRAFVFFD
jgi:hypothetical protein